MRLLLDTNVLSELRKLGNGKADAHVAAWAAEQDVQDLFLSAITILEIERGILEVQRRDPEQGSRLRLWLEGYVRPEFAGRILPVDDAAATRCAHLHIPDRRNEADAMIAATALVHNLGIATRNIRDFEGTGVVLINPWQR